MLSLLFPFHCAESLLRELQQLPTRRGGPTLVGHDQFAGYVDFVTETSGQYTMTFWR
jgi:hypothetical protein